MAKPESRVKSINSSMSKEYRTASIAKTTGTLFIKPPCTRCMIDEFCLFFSYHRDLWMQTELVSLCAALSPPSVSTYQDTCETSPGWCIWLSYETPGCVAALASRETDYLMRD